MKLDRLVIGVAFAARALAQDPGQSLTLEECVRKALAVPSAVTVARLDREIADKDHAIARAGYLPQASASFGAIYSSPSQLDSQNAALIPANAVREYIGLGKIFQEIDTSGRIRAEVARARANQQAAQASAGIAERDLKRAVSLAYYRLLLARRIVTAVHSSLDESQAFEKRVKQLEQGGEAARADVVKASTQVSILRQTLSSAQLAAMLANQDLAAYWTPDVDPLLNIQDIFDQPAAEATLAASTEMSPYLKRFEFRLFDAQRSGFQADARRAKSQLLPQLSWNFNYGLDSYRVDWRHRGYEAMATLNITLFDWFRTLNTARQSTARAQQVSESKSIAERRYSQEYRAALARVALFREQIAQGKEQVALAEEDFKLSRIRYEGGEGPALDVVVAQAQLVQARSSYYTTVSNYLGAKLDLEVAEGR
ncbi:MAG: TolC family protein [Bryobacteraceae bacterium]